MATMPMLGKDLIDNTPEGQRVAACLEKDQKVECQSCGAIWTQTDICYSCPGTVTPTQAVVTAIRKIARAWHEEGLTFDHLKQYLKVLEMEVQCLERGK